MAARRQQEPVFSLASVEKTGQRPRPYRVVLYGVHGVGKSTFAAGAPSPIFLPAEDGLSGLDVAAFPTPSSWSQVIGAVDCLTNETHQYKTLAIDTLDAVERLAHDEVCARHGKTSIEDFDYGRGFTFALDLWRDLIGRLDLLWRKKRMHVVALAHTSVTKRRDVISGEVDHYGLKINAKAGDLWGEWADSLLFARLDWTTVKAGKYKTKGVYTGERVLYSQWSPSYDAKDRLGLPAELDLGWSHFADAARSSTEEGLTRVRKELNEAIAKLPDEERERAIRARDEWAGSDSVRLIQCRDRALAILATTEAATMTAVEERGTPAESADGTTQ